MNHGSHAGVPTTRALFPPDGSFVPIELVFWASGTWFFTIPGGFLYI
jgi:hypothetical protein